VNHPLAFVDYHHGDLYYSLHLLFEERFGFSLYRPIGLDWFQKGFWKIAEPYGNAPGTIDQFLGIPQPTWSKEKEPTQRYGEVSLVDGIYHIPVKYGKGGSDEYVQKAITFEKFMSMDFDFIIATYNLHDAPWADLVSLHNSNHPVKAVYIRQIGDVLIQPKVCRNIMLATNEPMPPGTNYIRYHPEHSKEFHFVEPLNHNVVKSFIANPNIEPDLPLFLKFEKLLPNYTFKIHGILGRDGIISGELMPQAMKDSAFVWHVKRTGCGGFIPRQALASGRPCIIKKSYCYEYRTSEADLYEDSVNCIDLDLGNTEQNLEKIRYFSDPDRHTEMCRNAAEKFKHDVDFGREAESIKEWLKTL
jgi:hypothetical protein